MFNRIFSYITSWLWAIWRWMRSWWKWLIVAAIIFSLLGYYAYTRFNKPEEEETFVHPVRQDVQKTVRVSGVLDAKEKASLRFAAGGRLTYLGVKEGDMVKRSQTIARIDPRELQKRMQQDLNLYFNERMSFEQGLADLKDTAITTTDERTLQVNQKTLENSVLTVEIADIAVRNTALTAPFAGQIVTAPIVTAGIFIAPTEAFELVNPASLYFKAAVDETDIAQIKPGQKAQITLDAYPDETQDASVSTIAYRSAQSSTGTVFLIDIPLPPSATQSGLLKYRLGMNGDVSILTDTSPNTLAIPIAATRDRDDKTYVTVKTGPETQEERVITTGLITDDWVEVTSGLTEADEVLVP